MAPLLCTAAILLSFSFSVSSLGLPFRPWILLPQYQGSEEGKCGPSVTIETPACQVIEKAEGYELRNYPEGQMWATTLLANSSYRASTYKGFFRCFYYISGKNEQAAKVEMTGPVRIKPVPEANGYSIGFFVPSNYTKETVPTPIDPTVEIYSPPATTKAVLGPFGGFPDDYVYQQKWAALKALLDRDGVKYDESTVLYAGYSGPFTFANRKQEVWVDIVDPVRDLLFNM
eukprot:jgi/Mesen1/9353/ME000061S08797